MVNKDIIIFKTFSDHKEAIEFFHKSEAIHVHVDPLTAVKIWYVGTFGDIIELLKDTGRNMSLYDAAWNAFEKMGMPEIEIVENVQSFLEEHTQFTEIY